MKRALLVVALCFVSLPIMAQNKPAPPKKPTPTAAQLKKQLINLLCKDKDIQKSPGCEKVKSIFADSRLTLYRSVPEPKPTTPSKPKQPTGNPYLTSGFGLLTPESLERCRTAYAAHKQIFDDTEKTDGVPKEFICARLRIETNFGMPTPKTPYPLGANPIVNSLYTLYVRVPAKRNRATEELKSFLKIADMLGWDDIFAIHGSYMGAFGLSQHMPSSYLNSNLVADGDGDGKIDLFTFEDAVPSIAAHDKACGWSDDPQDQFNAIYCYNNSTDYVDAVRVYAWTVKIYLNLKPIDPQPMVIFGPLPLPLREDEIEFLNNNQPTSKEPTL